MKTNEQGNAHLILLGIIASIFVAGAGITVVSNSSKPGDVLYNIDRGAEKIQMALSFTSGLKEQANMSIAEERLKELDALFAEKNLDVKGVQNALSNFEDHKSKIENSFNNNGSLNEKEKEVKKELENKKSKIDKLFEGQQKSLESNRESLKKQYDQALKDGNTALATKLKTEIDGFETLLKQNEQQREDLKQKTEKKQSEAEKAAAEQQLKAEELLREAKKKAAENQ